ncbi:MAG TPA: amino acid adenylation domain-containing protein, partial [Thermoanaerobaculia bacterium]|nr:amino acid adenylation domain-containing protein [Thermoanaerobaculia bacterium]
GSTGRPKGVTVPHRAVVRLVRETDYARLGPGDRMGLVSNISFDAATWEIWGALLNGAALVVIPREVVLSASELAAAVREQEVTALFLTAALFTRMAREAPDAFAGVRDLLFGGDVADPAAARAVLASQPPGRLVNGYGPTESTTFASWHLFREVPAGAISLPIGSPLANTSLYVLDRRLAAVPPGAAGELFIGGDGLAWGYWNRPELTAERFVPHPWEAGGRLYRTGDLVRRPAGGALEFLGRIDQQVKIRGFRIEPGEIEAVLLAHGRVREAVVLHRKDLAGGAGLAAYVVVADEESTVPSELRQDLRDFLRQRLPDFMLPAAWVFLPSLPLTANGKVDRKALAKLSPERLTASNAAGAEEAPRTPTEELVAGIFAEVLQLDRVGVAEDFFALGGHSLVATQVASRVRSVFGVELPARSVFEAPTVEGLAAEIAALCAEGSLPEAPPLVRVERVGSSPLSFAQERLWFLQQLEPGSPAYNMPLEFELSGALSTGDLSAALTEVVRRHESLRTTFVPVDGVLCQRITPPVPAMALIALPLVDLSALPQAAGDSAADDLAQWHAAQGFDLERGPLCVWLLVRLTGERHRFLLNLHHAISDGWSLNVLANELGELYAASLERRPVRLPELAIQYADFAHWQRRWMAERQEEELAFWESRLGGEVASAELPTDRPRPAVQTFRGGRRQLVLSEDLTAQLKRFGRTESVTLFMTLLAATQALISRHSGEQDVAVGVPVAGRQWVETEGLIGCFLNTLVLRTDTSGQPSLRALAARVRTVTLEAYSHQNVPFEAVLARLGVRRDLSRAPLFQVLFNLLKLPPMELSLPGLELRGLMPAEVPSKLDMTFYISEGDASIGINLVYNADLFDDARMDEVLAQLDALLGQAVERPDEPLAHLSLVTAAARAVLPDAGAELLEPAFPGVARLLLEREEAQPDRPALCFGEDTWTFSRLGGRAREIARAIQAACGGPPAPGATGPVVAVCGPRSPELIASLYGAFLSGGVLLTLDRKLPAARLRLMMKVAKPACLVYVGDVLPEDGWLWELRELESLAIVSVPVASGVRPEPVPAEPATVFADPRPDDPAYIFFTSGTTGRPKAVLGRHKGLSHFLTWQRETFGVGPGDRAAQLTGLSFDVVLRDIFLPLTSGATLYVPDEAEMSPERILPWLAERAITVLHTVPSLAGAWLGGVAPGFSSDALRLTFFAGEPLVDQVVERWRAVFPRTEVVNLYGPTETTLAKCFYTVPDPPALRIQPVGAPLPQTQALVLAGTTSPAGGLLCGIGEVGEIVLRTPFRSLGYLNNPEENQLRFRPNPFREDTGDLLYFTGDRGRYRLDGTLEILGRLDTQVKIRGVRIEPAEIQVCLGRHEAVSESAVVLREVQPGDHRLVAYVVPRPGAVWDPEALRRHLRLELPEVMIPAAFVALDALPLTPNGKLDSRALPVPVLSGGEPGALHTPVQEITAGLWAELLGLAHVGPDDNFFELGGHSLIGARLIWRLREALGVDLPLRVLFEAPTLAALAAEIERLRRGAPDQPTITSFRQERSSPPPLSFAQERYWAGRHLEARSVASTIPMLMHLAGPLDLVCLRRAIAAVVDRHEILRTSFQEGPEGPIQVIHPAVPVALPEVDLERLTAPERMAEVRRFSILDGRLHFDYERPPLFRPTLFRCAAEEHVLLFTI